MNRRYYLSVRPLFGRHYPTRVRRNEWVSLHVVDPRASALEMIAAAVDLLEPWEHEAGRAAYRQPPVGHPLAVEFLDGMVLPFVPAAIRLPNEPPIQNALTHTPAYYAAYGRAFAWAINERWGYAQDYRHPMPTPRRHVA